MKTKTGLAFIIPTKNRPKEIHRLLLSIQSQSAKLSQIIIVDGGSTSLRNVLRDFTDLNINYLMCPTSLTEARNLGIGSIMLSITHVGFLDDDIVLEEDALEKMFSFWQNSSSEIGGVGFNITNGILRGSANFLKWPFFLSNRRVGAILRSGYNSLYCPVEKTQHVDWLFGGAAVWRREILDELKFDEWYEGYGFMEDMDFSYRVSRKYKLVILGEAKIKHLHAPGHRVSGYVFGKMQMINRLYFVKKYPQLSVLYFLWGSIGQVLENIVRSIVNRDRTFLFKSVGNIVGLYKIITGTTERLTSKKRIGRG